MKDEFTKWIEGQPIDVKEEFSEMSRIDKSITSHERPVPEINQGELPKPYQVSNLEYHKDELDEIHRIIYELYYEKKRTCKQIQNEHNISRRKLEAYINELKKIATVIR